MQFSCAENTQAHSTQHTANIGKQNLVRLTPAGSNAFAKNYGLPNKLFLVLILDIFQVL